MYSISFIYKNKKIEFKDKKVYVLYNNFLNWIEQQGYQFSGDIHNQFMRKILSLEEVLNLEPKYKLNLFHNINNKGKYILSSKCNSVEILDNIFKILTNFGINTEFFNHAGFEDVNSLRKMKLINKIQSNILNSKTLNSIEFEENPDEMIIGKRKKVQAQAQYKGFTNYNVIKNLLKKTGRNLHYKQLHYKLDTEEEMVICYHNDRLYAVIIHTWINNDYSNIKYIKTKW